MGIKNDGEGKKTLVMFCKLDDPLSKFILQTVPCVCLS